jgi:hypothetical protein
MYKLLLEQDKKRIVQEYTLRRIVVANGAMALVLLVLLVGLLPSYLISSSRRLEIEARTNISYLPEALQEQEELLAWITGVNNKLNLLAPELDTDRLAGLFGEFLKEEFPGIVVTDISWKRSAEGRAFRMSGVAEDRQKLIAFEEYINSSGRFAKTSVPVSQLARERNVEFNLILEPLGALSNLER